MLSLVVGWALTQGSLTAKTVARSDPMNGYEDYLHAADVLDESYSRIQNWELYVRGGRKGDMPDKPDDVQLDDPLLKIRTKMVDRYGQLLQMVSNGNQKSIYDPRGNYSFDTTFPEFARFKSVSRFEAMAAFVAFSEGRTDQGISEIIDGLRFGDRIGTGLIIGRLVGLACEAILLSELSDHLPQLSLEDARKLHAYADELLNGPSRGAVAIRRETQWTIEALTKSVHEPQKAADDADPALAQLARMSSAEREQTIAQVTGRIAQRAADVAAILEGPESEWVAGIGKLPDEDDGTPVGKLTSNLSIAYENIISIEARYRSRARLLRLNAMAIEYRWLNGKLPDRIEEFTTSEDRKDLVSGGNYVYKKEGVWYTLTSRGFGDYHDISLKASPSSAPAQAIDP